MSDYGLIVKNSDSDIQIDSLYKNFTYVDGGSQSCVSAEAPNEIKWGGSFTHPVFATKAAADYHALSYISLPDYAAYVYSASTQTIYWQAYQGGHSATLPTYGLIVRNPSGDIVFSSEDHYLNLVGVYTVESDTSYSNWDEDITVDDAVNNYFYLTNPGWFQWPAMEEPPDTCYFYKKGFKYVDSTTVNVAHFLSYQKAWYNCGSVFGNGNWIQSQLLEFLPASWLPADTWTKTLTANYSASVNNTIRQVAAAASISTSGSRVRVTCTGPTTGSEGIYVDNVAIVERSSDDDGTEIPTEIFFGGSSGFSLGVNQTITSDWMTFSLDETEDYLLIADVSSDSGNDSVPYNSASGDGCYLASGNSYNIQNGPSSTYYSGYTYLFTKIEVGV